LHIITIPKLQQEVMGRVEVTKKRVECIIEVHEVKRGEDLGPELRSAL